MCTCVHVCKHTQARTHTHKDMWPPFWFYGFYLLFNAALTKAGRYKASTDLHNLLWFKIWLCLFCLSGNTIYSLCEPPALTAVEVDFPLQWAAAFFIWAHSVWLWYKVLSLACLSIGRLECVLAGSLAYICIPHIPTKLVTVEHKFFPIRSLVFFLECGNSY